MPEVKHIKDSPPSVRALDEHNRPVELAQLGGCKILWTKKVGIRLLVRIQGYSEVLCFSSANDYEQVIVRQFT